MNKKQERRSNYPMPEEEMYSISDIKSFIDKERRHDEKERLDEVKQQKHMWRNVIIACGLLNLVLFTFAIIGYINNG
ncbi:MAG: hypothetical protein GY793_04875 [Proteobacteria bacterium]|nr:hypothetical protein [Pseudomonadota bacterium]